MSSFNVQSYKEPRKMQRESMIFLEMESMLRLFLCFFRIFFHS